MLRVTGVVVRFGDFIALRGVDLAVADGHVVSLLGPSGSGKTTLLRVIAGLEYADQGEVTWNGQDLRNVPAHDRGFGLMFQDFALFPHRDVTGNVEFGLRMRGDHPAARRARVAEVLEMVGLPGYARRRINGLSGGESQRVALARALAAAPRMIMLDEPLGSLDRTLRERLLGELRDLFVDLGITVLYVTHDQEEALAVADRTAVMQQGRVVQEGPPEEVWNRPRSEFVARFLGFTNIVDGDVGDDRAETPWGPIPLAESAIAGHRRILIRPDALAAGDDGAIAGVVDSVTFRGDRVLASIRPDRGPVIEASLRTAPPPGSRIRLDIDPTGVVVIDPDAEE